MRDKKDTSIGDDMNTLPKELTPELLGLVTRDYVQTLEIVNNEIHYSISSVMGYKAINIDTLTREMIEYIGGYYIFNIFNSSSVMGYVVIIEDEKFIANSIFEAVLKATHWVTKEKGAI